MRPPALPAGSDVVVRRRMDDERGALAAEEAARLALRERHARCQDFDLRLAVALTVTFGMSPAWAPCGFKKP
jgi:hypothetical protein